MTEAIDAALFVGVGFVAYEFGGVGIAGVALIGSAILMALLSTIGDEQ